MSNKPKKVIFFLQIIKNKRDKHGTYLQKWNNKCPVYYLWGQRDAILYNGDNPFLNRTYDLCILYHNNYFLLFVLFSINV